MLPRGYPDSRCNRQITPQTEKQEEKGVLFYKKNPSSEKCSPYYILANIKISELFSKRFSYFDFLKTFNTAAFASEYSSFL